MEVDGAPYQLSYRRGYFADGSARQKDPPSRARTRLLLALRKLEASELRDRPMFSGEGRSQIRFRDRQFRALGLIAVAAG